MIQTKTQYKSKEELYFSWYLDELKEQGLISGYEYEIEPYVLFESFTYYDQQFKKKINIREHIYTPDFIIYNNKTTWLSDHIETKGSFDKHNMIRLFSINQKWMMQKYGIYVQKIIPSKLFKSTFTPKRYLLTDSGIKSRKINHEVVLLEDYIKELKNGKIDIKRGPSKKKN